MSRLDRALLFLLAFGFLLPSGCASTVVRDKAVYRDQIIFLGHAAREMAKGQVIRAVSLARGGDVNQCVAVGDHALAYSILAPYHEAFALFLGDLGPDPGAEPVVPDTHDWCLRALTSTGAGGIRNE